MTLSLHDFYFTHTDIPCAVHLESSRTLDYWVLYQDDNSKMNLRQQSLWAKSEIVIQLYYIRWYMLPRLKLKASNFMASLQLDLCRTMVEQANFSQLASKVEIGRSYIRLQVKSAWVFIVFQRHNLSETLHSYYTRISNQIGRAHV